MVIISCIPTWIQKIIGSYIEDAHVRDILTLLEVDSHGPNLWHYSTGILRKKDKIYILYH
ncbi:hypothetical protein H5410_032018 [Solanum commersonii]|uniref:Uncharacterized protein n=1 Tax=Solanum commersonii TaxID=4109 RepID=A0A9J5YLS9_SOLCO|nr:hypothetical protein H5410_032018 [Solanum commersonii]